MDYSREMRPDPNIWGSARVFCKTWTYIITVIGGRRFI